MDGIPGTRIGFVVIAWAFFIGAGFITMPLPVLLLLVGSILYIFG